MRMSCLAGLLAAVSAIAVSACAMDAATVDDEAELTRSDAIQAEVLKRFGPDARIVSADDPVMSDVGIDALAGWCGTRHITNDNATAFGGWVDGNGPDTYAACARCNSGQVTCGVTRWCGDRRQSTATCGDGIRSRWWVFTHPF
jgi:hypothetical protein